MAPIDSLPEELLSLIFHATFEELKASSASIREDAGTLPDLLNILLVSSHWNQVAVATPSLWTFIELRREGFDRVRQHVRRDLVRSKSCPLDVVVRVFSFIGSEELNALDSLFEEVAQHSHRWQTLELCHMTHGTHYILEQMHLPRLVSLSIMGGINGRSLKLNTPILKRYKAPEWDSNLVSFEHPLPIFTHLLQPFTSLRTGPAETFLQHLRHSRHVLTALTIIFTGPPGMRFSLRLGDGTEFPAENLDLSLPSLTQYTVKFVASWSWNTLRIAHMPHLRRLDIHWQTFEQLDPNSAVPFMPELRRLDIFAHYPQGFKNAALPLLAATPNLEEVSLTQTYPFTTGLDAEWLSPLLYPYQDPRTIAWPRLVVLRLHGMAIPVCDDLRRMAFDRPPFKRLSVDSKCWKKTKEVGQDLDTLREYFDIVVTGDQ